MKTKEQPKPPALSDRVVRLFCDACSAAHERWRLARILFDENRSSRAQLAGDHGRVCLMLQTILYEISFQTIARLHDPAAQNQQVNLTCDYVIRFGGWDAATRKRLEALSARMDPFVKNVRKARNKVLSHGDLEAHLSGKPVGKFSRGQDVKYFAALQEFVNVVHESTSGGPWPFDDLIEDDAKAFVPELGPRSRARENCRRKAKR